MRGRFFLVKRLLIVCGRTDEYSSGDLKEGRQETRLDNGEDFGADAGAEGVGDVVGADAEGQNEGDYEADDDEPEQIGRVRFHHLDSTRSWRKIINGTDYYFVVEGRWSVILSAVPF